MVAQRGKAELLNVRFWPLPDRSPQRNVCFWHKADIEELHINVRFEGKADIAADWTQTDFYGFTKFVGWPSTGSIIRPTA